MKRPKRRISLTRDADVIEKLKILAENDGRTLSQYINRYLKSYTDTAKAHGGPIDFRL